MICQECQQGEANVYITKIVNGKKTEHHLCEKCAREKEELDFSFEPKFTLHNLFGSLLNDNARGSRELPRGAKAQCPACALTFAQFSQIGRLGCSECFSAFGEKLQPLLRRIHGSSRNTGKVPRRSQSTIRFKRELENLREQLQQHIQREEFEEAARLRDRIRSMEQGLSEGSGGG
jgi:protein arginine kinase activator